VAGSVVQRDQVLRDELEIDLVVGVSAKLTDEFTELRPSSAPSREYTTKFGPEVGSRFPFFRLPFDTLPIDVLGRLSSRARATSFPHWTAAPASAKSTRATTNRLRVLAVIRARSRYWRSSVSARGREARPTSPSAATPVPWAACFNEPRRHQTSCSEICKRDSWERGGAKVPTCVVVAISPQTPWEGPS
jgi:hypothetical protein